jgi:hypothetical protein
MDMAAKKTLVDRLTTGFEVKTARDYVGIPRVAMLIPRKDGGVRLVLPARIADTMTTELAEGTWTEKKSGKVNFVVTDETLLQGKALLKLAAVKPVKEEAAAAK